MEKRFTLALLLSLVVIVAWNVFNMPDKPPEEPRDKPGTAEEQGKRATEPQKTGQAEKTRTDPGDRDPSGKEAASKEPKAPREAFPEEEVRLRNRVLEVTLTNRGGCVKHARLLDQFATSKEREDGGPNLEFLADYGGRINDAAIGALTLSHAEWPEADLEGGRWTVAADSSGRRVTFSRSVKRGKEQDYELAITKEIWLPSDDSRRLEFKIAYRYLGAGDGNSSYTDEFRLLTTGGVWQEKGAEMMSPASSFVFPEEAGSEDGELIPGAGIKESKEGRRTALRGPHRYVADLSSYFAAYLYAGEGFPQGTKGVVYHLPASESSHAAALRSAGGSGERTYSALEFDLDLEIGAEATQQTGFLYLGSVDIAAENAEFLQEQPEVVEALMAVAEDRLGFASSIAKLILGLLRWLHGLCGNWGWAIVMLTVLVRIVLFPINRRSQGAMLRHGEAMAKIKPKIEALKKKHEKDPRRFAQEQMALMKREGVSMVPLGGCLPILLQIPIFFGLFSALRTSIDLRQAAWWWVPDLSQPDHLITFDSPVPNPMQICAGCCQIPIAPITGLHILPILMTLAWFLNSYLMPRPTTTDPQMEQQRKMMMFMPVFFGFLMYGYAAGLSLYWLTSSTIGIIETKVIKKLLPVKAPAPKPS